MTVPAVASPAQIPVSVICPDASCSQAVSHESLCECLHCLGAGHGIVHRPARELAAAAVTARIARTGDVFLGAANDDDCEAF